MWNFTDEPLSSGRGSRFNIVDHDAVLSYAEVVELWCNDPEFGRRFTSNLAASRLNAFRWETPPVSRLNQDRVFEFVLLDCPALERAVDHRAFADHFDDKEIVTFSNLGGDATLVVPCPRDAKTSYGHLAAFLRTGTESQTEMFWRSIGQAMSKKMVGIQPVWLSTAGMGVSWLHVRLDSRPKYYGHTEYKIWN